MSVPEGTFCTFCLKEGYKCIAWDYNEQNVACCTFHLDREKCPHKNAPRTVVINHESVKEVEKKAMSKPEQGKLCKCGCGERLRPGSTWLFIRGHKQDPGGLPNQRKLGKSSSELTVADLIAKFDSDIAELQRAKELLMKYAGEL